MYIYIFFLNKHLKLRHSFTSLISDLNPRVCGRDDSYYCWALISAYSYTLAVFFFRGRWRQLSPKNSTHQQLCVVQECSVFKAFHYFSLAEFQDVNVMVILGFGFLWTFLVRYGFSGAGFNLLVAVVATQCAVILNGIDSWYYRGKIRINLRRWVTIESLLLLSPLFVLIQLRQLDLCNISI